jgi:hypothetical protein
MLPYPSHLMQEKHSVIVRKVLYGRKASDEIKGVILERQFPPCYVHAQDFIVVSPCVCDARLVSIYADRPTDGPITTQ